VSTALEPYTEVAARLTPWISAEIEAKVIPALMIALVDDERIVWSRGFGFANPARSFAATADTPGRVGSVSKLFTDLALMQLVESGKLDLDAPVSRVLPEFAPRNPFGTPITLRQLMAHRAGLVREPPVGHYFDPAPPSLIEVVKSLNNTDLVYEPGTRTKYSNAGIAVVGAVIERVRGEPFSESIRTTLLEPTGMGRTSFEPGPELARDLAIGSMWSYDGQPIATPTFLLGTGPAGNLVSTVTDLGRFLTVLFADGLGPGGPLLAAETLRSMLSPQLGKPGETPGFGLGFALSTLENERRIGHGGAVYGFATEVSALPDSKLGAVVIATKDCANGTAKHVAETALRLMLAVRNKKPLPTLKNSTAVSPEQARRLKGHYVADGSSIDLFSRNGKLFLAPFEGGQRLEVRSLGNALLLDDCLHSGSRVVEEANRIVVGGKPYERAKADMPGSAPERWAGLIGEYGWDHDVLYILEDNGDLHALIEWFFDYPLQEDGPDRFRFPEYGLYEGEALLFKRDAAGRATEVEAASVVFRRRNLDGEDGKTFRITPVRPVAAIRSEVASASPPKEPGEFRTPYLVDLATLDPTIKLDIRYATSNNFLGTPLYTSSQAFLQRPAAEALVRAHRALGKLGYGLLIHDAYRPWQITKLFWEATPESGRIFVADPSQGSKHNRGAAVDLTLYDRQTGSAIEMVGGYDEFSPRSFPDYPGGTSRQRWHRELLRRTMEAEGFTVFPFEWWHFDHADWHKYPILNRRFEELGRPATTVAP
jgi:CubicO group peptidase (beta-lactamase class C family)/D-alanyl-D-alanine dipeptidase